MDIFFCEELVFSTELDRIVSECDLEAQSSQNLYDLKILEVKDEDDYHSESQSKKEIVASDEDMFV